MLINSFSPVGAPSNKPVNNTKQEVEASFGSMLAAKPSAQANAAGPAAIVTLSGQAQTRIDQFHEWKQEWSQGMAGYQNDINKIENASADFENIISKAVAQNADADPQGFIKSLSTAELSTLQTIHGLADPIQPDGLSKEGALNLFHSRNNLQDINKDGFEDVGLGKTYVFPPPNAPESLKNAWKETTRNMSPEDKFNLESSFLPISVELGGKGGYLPPDTDYSRLVQDKIEGFVLCKPYNTSPEARANLEKQISLLGDFLKNLGGVV